MLPNVLKSEEIGMLDQEVRKYTVDDTLSTMAVNEEDPDFRLDDDWWVHVMKRKEDGHQKYPVLSKLVKALLSVFTGPLVESSFNIMGDILEEDRTSLTTYNYESLAMIKSSLSAHGEKAVTTDISQKMKHDVCYSYSKYEKFLQKTKHISNSSLTASTSTLISSNSKEALTTNKSHLTSTSSKQDSSSKVPKNAAPAVQLSSNLSQNPPTPPPTTAEPTTVIDKHNTTTQSHAESMKRKQAPIMDFFKKKPKLG